ncbi:hypothetical protein F7725_017482 [Dissostichus mawsoni]|uniref:Uncharacterized protein n=1 Tax=Dissostichus mawsoni TaxID=36200 RepID=A0A7J5Z6L5_DISMA|nr:hypothetical protein F7725_017482 [Dissostichus mawsoni]
MPLCVSLKLYSVVFHHIKHIFHSLFPPPAAADWLSSLPLVVLQQCDSAGGVADVGPGSSFLMLVFKPLNTWATSFMLSTGLIFVVDSNDPERIKEAADELHRMLEEDELRDVAVLLFANKQDLPRAMSVSDITEALRLSGVSQPASCAVSGSGLVEGLDWLSDQILKK